MRDVLLLGAGDLGSQIGFDLVDTGARVTAVRRRVGLVSQRFIGVGGDLTDGLPDLPPMHGAGGGPDLLVICLTAGGRDEKAYRAVFLDALARILADVRARGWAPERAVFVSSTSVCAPSGDVDEATPPAPQSPTGEVLLEAEKLFFDGLPAATRGVVVRPSGIYGPGRTWFVDQVREGRLRDPQRMTHRVHRDDLARAIVHLLTMTQAPDDLYLVTDDAPAPAGEVAAFVAQQIGVPARPEWQAAPDAPVDRLLSNARLRATGFEFAYPTYHEGYRAVLSGAGERHP